jgi:hypothetical protein
MTTQKIPIIHISNISSKILLLRNQRVLIDSDLASLYGVTTKRLNEQVKRNIERFPADFMFQLTTDEKNQVVAICDHLKKLKFSNTNPYVFTEHGAIMAASVLNTSRAINVGLLVVRTFVKLRQIMSTQKELRHKLIELEQRLDGHDETLQTLVSAIRQLMEPPAPKKKHPIGFSPWSDEESK